MTTQRSLSAVNPEEKDKIIKRLLNEVGTKLLDMKTARQLADNAAYQHLSAGRTWAQTTQHYLDLCNTENKQRKSKASAPLVSVAPAHTNGHSNGAANGNGHREVYTPRTAAATNGAATRRYIADELAGSLPDGDVYTITASNGDKIVVQNTSKQILNDDDKYTPEENKAIKRILKEAEELMGGQGLTEDEAIAVVMQPLLDEATAKRDEKVAHALYILKRSLRAHSGIAGSSIADDSLIGQALQKAAEKLVEGKYADNTAALDAAMAPIIGKKTEEEPSR